MHVYLLLEESEIGNNTCVVYGIFATEQEAAHRKRIFESDPQSEPGRHQLIVVRHSVEGS